MVATRQEATTLISAMPDRDFRVLRDIMNRLFVRDVSEEERADAILEFMSKMHKAEESVENGECATTSELREYLGVN